MDVQMTPADESNATLTGAGASSSSGTLGSVHMQGASASASNGAINGAAGSQSFTKMVSDEDQVSPTILQNKLALEREKAHDQLNRRLSHRPTKTDLKLRNILRVDSNDSIEQAGLSLEKSMNFEKRSNELRSILKKRPEKAALEGMNILKSGDVHPSLVATQQQLRRAQLEDSLENKLRDRPPIQELEQKKIINFSEVVEVLPTFRKSEYNRKPDTNATFRKLTPQLKVQIREELNTFKKNEMPVHEQ
ncbi:hypothetical protein HK102_008217, partial [Quaeritorhiza haematococci]